MNNQPSNDDEANACPDCGSLRLYGRRSKLRRRPDSYNYLCENCGFLFNEPDRRPKKGHTKITRSCLAKRLADADPDDVTAND